MGWSRRGFLKSLSRTALVLSLEDVLTMARGGPQAAAQEKTKGSARQSYEAQARPAPKGAPSPVTGTPLGVQFVDVAKQAGLNVETIFGGEHRNKYLLETTGCGAAFFDYDQDDWLDIFLVNGWRLEGFPKGHEPVCHLFKNNRDGTFTDVTLKAGLARSGWGQACCVGDYNNDGWNDLFVSYYGQNALFRNNGNGTFTDVTKEAGLLQDRLRWNSGCSFVDYDKDGRLDLFVGNYIDLDLKTTPLPEDANCTYKGIVVACGPPGLEGGKNLLYHNNGDGTFTDVSEKAGMWGTLGTYALSCGAADLDNTGWPNIYVANDSTSATYYVNQKDGTFKDQAIEAGVAYSPDGKPQAGMGVSDRRLQPRWAAGHCEDELRGRYGFAVYESGRWVVRRSDVSGGAGDQHAAAGMGRELHRHRQRWVARHSGGEWARVSRGGWDAGGCELCGAEVSVSEFAQWAV